MAIAANRLITLELSPRQVNIGLLILRILVGSTLFLRHGWEKVGHMSHGWQTFGDPIGVGGHASFIVAMLSDGICSVLLALGLLTRWVAAFIAFNVFVAWAAAHHFVFFGRQGASGEICVLYIAVGIALFFTGPGRYSLDRMLFTANKP